MRKIPSLLLLVLFLPVAVIAQMPSRGGSQVAIIGWTDDTHYIIRTLDSEKNQVTRIEDIRTGRGTTGLPPKSARELLSESLPDGTTLGMSDAVSQDMNSAVFLRKNDLFFFTGGLTELRQLTSDETPEVNARFSPDGSKIAYTKNKDLYVYDLKQNREIRITTDASERIYNGYSSWVYMEEILGRASRYAAFWWSPDGMKIAWLRTDETEVPVFTLNRLDEPDGVHGILEVTPYPKPGDPNPKVKMGIADLSNLKTAWVDTDYTVDQYLAWPFWTPDSKNLAIQVVNRDQNELKIILADAASGRSGKIYEESNSTWLEFREDIHVLADNSGFIIRSFKSGWENLYYYGWEGQLRAQLTNFNFRVTSIDRVDEKQRTVYFSATGTESTDSHGFSVGFDGKNLVQITRGEGTHSLSISPNGSYSIDTWSSITTPGSIIAYDRKGKQIREIHRFEIPAFNPGEHSKTEFVKISTSDGLFNMPATITYPVNFDPSKKYPVIFTIYGGPDSKNVYNRWPGTTPSWYSRNGIVTFRVDHRGSGQFGKEGMDYLHRNLGKWEILDYADAVRWLRGKPWVDAGKMGMTGSSYGGYMTCLALTKGADFWTHGYAGSSVTDWRLYDNIYTERFMDTPRDNPEGYREGSALTYAKDYKGKLYMTHGDIDDNVHMQNTIWLASKLQDGGKPFELMIYPNNRHGIGGMKAMHNRNAENSFWLKSFFGVQ
jgi:dipeptidyl-peptidase 4